MNDIQTNDALFKSIGLSTQRDQKPDDKKIGQQQFLELMVAQIRNQDPFKPLENGEFLTQIAQFSQVSGIQDLQNSFSQFANSLGSNQALQASALVGRTVYIPGEVATLTPGENFSGVASLPQSTTNLTVSIYDAAGALVKNIDLGERNAGTVSFNWDGTDESGQAAPAGPYKIVATANIDGKNTTLGTLVSDKVESVTIGKAGQGTILNLSSLGSVGLNDIYEIR